MSAVKYRRYIIKFYNKTAIIRDHESFNKIITLLENIDQYHFELTLNSSLLNTWPNSTLMLAGYWTPALKNNPLHNNNPQIAEAVDVNDTDEGVLINDHNRSEESYTSSLSSSFVDSEFLRKPPIIMDEEIRWQLIMKQPSTSYITPSLTKDIHSVDVLKDISSGEDSVTKPDETITKEVENSSETLTTEQNAESLLNKEAKYNAQSFNELLESYNLRVKSSSDSPKMEDLYKKFSVPRIIEEQCFNEPETLDDVNITKFKINILNNYLILT